MLQSSSCSQCCSLNKLVVLVLMGGFLTLCLDIRWEHIDVARKYLIPWIPIIYSGLMVFVSILGLAFWDKGGRQLLLWAYTLSLVVGLLGLWFHNHGNVIQGVLNVLSAWDSDARHKDHPPEIAPLAFCGLGLLGIIATAKRFQPQTAPTVQT